MECLLGVNHSSDYVPETGEAPCEFRLQLAAMIDVVLERLWESLLGLFNPIYRANTCNDEDVVGFTLISQPERVKHILMTASIQPVFPVCVIAFTSWNTTAGS